MLFWGKEKSIEPDKIEENIEKKIGIDWRANKLRFVEVEERKSSKLIIKAGIWNLPEERDLKVLIEEEKRNKIISSLKQFNNLYELQDSKINISLPSKFVKIDLINILSSDDIENKKNEVINNIYGDNKYNYNIDTYEIKDSNKNILKILIVGCNNKLVNSTISIFNKSDFDVKSVNVNCFNLQNIIENIFTPKNDEISFILDIYPKEIEFVTTIGNNFYKIETLPLIKPKINESIDEPLIIKNEITAFNDLGEEYFNALSNALIKKINITKKKIEEEENTTYYSKIYVCGSITKIDKFMEIFDMASDNKIKKVNPFTNIKISDSFTDRENIINESSEYTLATSLVLTT